MNFLIIKDKDIVNINVSYIDNLSIINDPGIYILKLSHINYIESNNDNFKIIKFGDILNYDKGLYYTIKQNYNYIEIYSDIFNYLPIYYAEKDNKIIVSSSYKEISRLINSFEYNKRYYVYLTLFYTPINDITLNKYIHRLSFGSSLIIKDNGIEIKKKYRFYDYFSKQPLSYKKDNINSVVDSFIDNIKYYYDDENAISLTGGYDGRSIVSCAHYYNKDFHTFSYGKKGSLDVEIPMYIANKLGIEYELIELDGDYLLNSYQINVDEYIYRSGGLNGFLYPQSLFYVKKLSNYCKNIMTGYVGSEIIRSFKEYDCEILSPIIYYILLNNNKKLDEWINLRYQEWNDLNLITSQTMIAESINDIKDYFNELPSDLTQYQKLLTFLYENLFINLFGTWVYNGMHYARIRVPFIDPEFFSLISKTKVSAYYMKFPENNLRKRLNSCKFYSYLYRKTWPQLGKIPITKGYTPEDLITPFGFIRVALAYRNAKNFKDPNGLDKLSTVTGALNYINNLENLSSISNEEANILRATIKSDAYSRTYGFLALSKIKALNIFSK
ncbi:MAG: hypothetical protein WCS13_01355 [Candidatus Cloacimonadaceae bacterium]|jgi:hypothetical protein